MKPSEAKLIVEKAPSEAVSLTILALRHGEEMWRDFLNAGLIKAIASRASDRRNLLDGLIQADNKQEAKQIIDAVFDSLKKPQQDKMMTSERGSSVFLSHWFYACSHGDKPGGGKYEYRFDGEERGLDVLLGALAERGLNVNPEFTIPGKHGHKIKTSVMCDMTEIHLRGVFSLERNEIKSHIIPIIEMLVRHGARLDDATRDTVLGDKSTERMATLVSALDLRGIIGLSEWVEGEKAKLPENQENASLIQAMLAKQVIEKTIGAHRASPGA